jgi:WhiB family redox-sensing transcriptional regulator
MTNATHARTFGSEPWMADAACAGLSSKIFFPSDGAGVAVAQRVCADCPVRDLCLEYALANHIESGVWGGASEEERRRMRRRSRASAPRG